VIGAPVLGRAELLRFRWRSRHFGCEFCS